MNLVLWNPTDPEPGWVFGTLNFSNWRLNMGKEVRTARSSKTALCHEALGRVTKLISLVALSVFITATLTPSIVSAQEDNDALEVVELGYSVSYPELLMSSDVQSNTDLKQLTIPGSIYGLDGFLLVTPSDHSFEAYVTNSTGNLAAFTGLVNLGNNTTAWAEVACFYNADSIYRTTTVEIGAYSNNGGYPGTLLTSASGTFSLAPGMPLENCIVFYSPSGPVTAPSSVFLATSFTTGYGAIGLLADSNGPQNTVFGAYGFPYYNATWLPFYDDVKGLALYAVVEDASGGGGGGGGPCNQDLTNGVLCLRDGRFEFIGTWTDFANPPNTQPLIWTPVQGINATAGFQNNPSGVQVVMRVADGCSLTGTWWVWLGGFTDAGWDIQVRDTVTGKQKTFTRNRQSGSFPTTLRDNTTFNCN